MKTKPKRPATWSEFADLYCETQETTPAKLRTVLTDQAATFKCLGWFMLECAMMDSSRLGERTILPYGGHSTHKTVPTRPVSPRGLASDMAVVIATILVKEVTT